MHFCLRDDIGLAPHMQVHLDMTDKMPFFYKTFYSERRNEIKNRQRNG